MRTDGTLINRVFSTLDTPDRRYLAASVRVAARAALLIGIGMILLGCQAPGTPNEPTETVLHIADYDAYVDAASSVLRRYDFPPQFVDRERGTIVSRPATSGQWFEPWRVDSQGGYQLVESSMHTMRRVVSVDIQPVEMKNAAAENEGPRATGDYRLRVRVDKLRFSAPQRQITTASGVMAIYSERVPTRSGRRGPQSQGGEWVPLGRDGLLEIYFLDKLAAVAGAQTVHERVSPDGV